MVHFVHCIVLLCLVISYRWWRSRVSTWVIDSTSCTVWVDQWGG